MKKLIPIIIISVLLLTGCTSEKYILTSQGNTTGNTYEEPIELSYDEYKEKIDNNDSFIVLLYQTGCSHCESFEPKLNEIVKTYNLEIYALNLADLSEKEYAVVKNKTFVSGTPTTVFIKEGKYENKLVGDKDEKYIFEFLISCGYLEEK
jgi:thiol-disulfide isomerase/thioredoxin